MSARLQQFLLGADGVHALFVIVEKLQILFQLSTIRQPKDETIQ
jgi:hypothetical protein